MLPITCGRSVLRYAGHISAFINRTNRQNLLPRPSLLRQTRPFSSHLRLLNTSQHPLVEYPTHTEERVRTEKPSYKITFTCKPCSTRSTHWVTKQGYHHGSVLITCPECRNRHIISDHLNVFGNKDMTVEDFMKDRGQLVKKGTLSEDGDLEFWEDGTRSSQKEREAREGVVEMDRDQKKEE